MAQEPTRHLREWLTDLGLGQYAEVFASNDIDWDLLPELTNDTLKDIGIGSAGHRLRILKAIKLQDDKGMAGAVDVATTGVTRSALPSAEAERRQLTVMFADLVGSTALSLELDPEHLRDVIRAYQDACAGAVSRFDGYIAQFLGDGVMVYFGFPRAHEDDAERAAHAALELLTAVRRLPALESVHVEVRIGIATGVVVVGDIVGQAAAKENMVVGDTPNLAARLQGVAEPGTVLVSERTRQLAGNQFVYEEAAIGALKGFAEPVRAWRIVGERRGQSRFGARHTGLSAFIGREREVELLLERWRQAASGEGQVVLLSGEAGIGKSRIVEALRERITDPNFRHLRYQCSPYHVGSPFYPVIQQLEFAAGLSPEDDADTRLEKLAALLRLSAATPETVALLAGLLAIPTGGRYPSMQLAPQAYRAALLQALVNTLEGLAASHPMLFFVEDLHWIDPSTAEMFERIIDRFSALPVLLVATYRPDYVPQWTSYPHCTVLTLNRLSRESCARLITETASGRSLPVELVEQIIARTDGVPLFVEELTKTMLESDLLTATDDGYVLKGPLLPLAIPSTLQDSLMARLDQRSDAREVAQLAAVIGRRFSHAILAAVANEDDDALQGALDELLQSGLIYRRGGAADAVYEFKHALVRDIAYQSMLKSRRAMHHAAIARALETHFPAVAEREPAMMAHHFSEAGLIPAAIDQWRRAGAQAVARSAGQEAAGHFKRALAMIEASDGADRHRLELAIRIDLGPVLMTIGGFASQETIDCYRRARELCDLTGDRTHLFPATWGIWCASNHLGRAEASRLADELIEIGRAQSDSGLLLEAYHAAWTSSLRDRDLKSTYEYATRGIELYRPDRHHRHTFQYGGHDPGVCCRMVAAMTQCVRGFVSEARELAVAGVDLAQRLGHPFSHAMAVSFSATVFAFRREPREVADRAELSREICDKHGFPQLAATALCLAGWANAAQGQLHAGLPLMVQGIDLARRIGVTRISFHLNLMAEAYGWAGDTDRGFAALEQAQSAIRDTGEQRWEAETFRIMGDLHLQARDPHDHRAELAYRRALEIARTQDAKLFELRAATGLARSLGPARASEARGTMAPIVDWFAPADDIQDVRDARTLLDELA